MVISFENFYGAPAFGPALGSADVTSALADAPLRLWIVSIAFVVACFGCGSKNEKEILAQLPSKPNVLVITTDTTRADHLPVYGYKSLQTPNLDSLAKHGIVFQECATAAPLTLPSHCSIMTGTYPTYHGVRINGNTALSTENFTMAEAFESKGYATGAFIGAFVLDGRWGLNQGFQHYDDQFDLKKYKKLDLGMVQRPGNEVVDAALSWLQTQKSKPFFAWVHLYDPHTPYTPPEPYRSQYASRGMPGLYDAEIAFMDSQIGRCLAWLKDNGLDKNTIVAVMGDHGEGLGDHGELTHGFFIYDYAIHVPFILSVPVKDSKGIVIPSQVRTIDLYPTLLQAAGIGIPKQTQGTSLWKLIEHRGKEGERLFAYSESMEPSIQYGWSPLLALRTTKYKLIDAPRKELFDLEKDPDELTDLHASKSNVTQDFEKALKSVVAESSAGAPEAHSANLDSETVERLAALGYIGSAVKTKSATGTTVLVDPKDKLPVHEAINQAGELNNNDQYDESAALLEKVLKDDPHNPQARLLLATDYMELKRSEDAAKLLRGLLDEDPQNIRALVCLAKILQDEGKTGEVIQLCKEALAVDERNTQALTMLGQAYLDLHDFDQAKSWLEKAVAVQPKLTQNQLNLAACLIGLKKYDEAKQRLATIIESSPKFPKAHYHLGLLYEETGQYPDAIREYEQEIGDHGNSFMARFNLGRLKLKMGDQSGYMEQMQQVVKLAPNNPAGYLFLARGLLQENADLNEIKNLSEQGLSLARTPEYKAMGYFLLADIYNRKNQPELMRQALLHANEYKSQIPNY